MGALSERDAEGDARVAVAAEDERDRLRRGPEHELVRADGGRVDVAPGRVGEARVGDADAAGSVGRVGRRDLEAHLARGHVVVARDLGAPEDPVDEVDPHELLAVAAYVDFI